VITANSSSMNFNLPIQKNPQREIADFILNSSYFEQVGTGAIGSDFGLEVPESVTEVMSEIVT